MYIMSMDGRQIINSEYPERFCVVEHPDASLIIASYRDDRPPVTLARYVGKEAQDELNNLLLALVGGQSYYYMPPSKYYNEEQIKKDARTRRRGGS